MGKHKIRLIAVTCDTHRKLLVEEQATEAKAYQQSIQSDVNGLYNDYYVALENGYTPNISKYKNT